MKKIVLCLALNALATSGFAIPNAIVTGTDSYNGYATVSGRLSEKPNRMMGVSVRNGNTSSSTIADEEGRWSVVFRHLSTQFFVTAWDIARPGDRSGWTAHSIGAPAN